MIAPIDMIFVVGASRSGTTMLSRILGMHKEAYALNELHYFGDLAPPAVNPKHLSRSEALLLGARLVARAKNPIWKCVANSEDKKRARQILDEVDGQLDTNNLFKVILQGLKNDYSSRVLIDHTPRNIFYASELLRVYPQARIIMIMRDPRAVLYSQKKRWQIMLRDFPSVPLRETLRTWINYHPITMSHLWNRVISIGSQLKDHERFFMLRYEDILFEPEERIRQICNFLELSFSEEMLDVQQVGSSHNASRQKQTGISLASFDLWREGLTPDEIRTSEFITGDMMSQMGYRRESGHGIKRNPLFIRATYPFHLLGALLVNPRRVLAHIEKNESRGS